MRVNKVDNPDLDPFRPRITQKTFEVSNRDRSICVHGVVEGRGRSSLRVKELHKILTEVLERYYVNLEGPENDSKN